LSQRRGCGARHRDGSICVVTSPMRMGGLAAQRNNLRLAVGTRVGFLRSGWSSPPHSPPPHSASIE